MSYRYLEASLNQMERLALKIVYFKTNIFVSHQGGLK
jgi:hypothetical protein